MRASFGIAHHLQYTCDWLRPDTWLASEPASGGSDRLDDLGEADLLVVVSQAPYTRPVVEAAQELHARGVPVLALTDSPLSPLAAVARWVLLFDTDASGFFHSMAGGTGLGRGVDERGGRLAAVTPWPSDWRSDSSATAMPAPIGSAVRERLAPPRSHLRHAP